MCLKQIEEHNILFLLLFTTLHRIYFMYSTVPLRQNVVQF